MLSRNLHLRISCPFAPISAVLPDGQGFPGWVQDGQITQNPHRKWCYGIRGAKVCLTLALKGSQVWMADLNFDGYTLNMFRLSLVGLLLVTIPSFESHAYYLFSVE